MKREAPPVGAPYGMPRNFDTPPCVVPRIEPEVVLATGDGCCESVLARVLPPAHTATAALASPLATVLLSITMCPLQLRAAREYLEPRPLARPYIEGRTRY
jgi:hypothetical protein